MNQYPAANADSPSDQIATRSAARRGPNRPRSPERAQAIHIRDQARHQGKVRAAIDGRAREAAKVHTWRNRRWAVLIIVNLLFTLSFWLDIQILEGALTASRFIGFHLIDLNSALQVMLAHKHIITNLVIGTLTVATLWLLLGGRTFCSWVCPYHLLSPSGPRSCTSGWPRRSWSPTST
jgi:ferredoxin-type protein NapH